MEHKIKSERTFTTQCPMTLDLCPATAKGCVVLMNLLVLVFKTHMFNKFLFFIKISIQNQPEMLYLKILKFICIFVYIVIYMEKEMAPHSSIHAWKIPWTEEPGRLQSMGSLRVGHEYSCLENPSDEGAWWAVYGVTQSRTRLKRLSSSSSDI